MSKAIENRRGFLRLAGSLAGAGVATGALAEASSLKVPPRTREQGATAPAYGQPRPSETIARYPRLPARFPGALSTVTPLQGLHGILTPSGLHFERHHANIPAIDPDRHRLAVHGLVERPLTLTMDDILRFPAVSRLHFLECSGNTPWLGAKPDWTVQDSHGLISCAEWTGVELSTLLAEVGVKPGASWILAEGADACAMTRSIPLDALDGAILAYAQNGERLAAGAGLSPAAVPAGAGGQPQHQVAAPYQGRRPPVPDPRGDLKIHRPDAGWQRAPVHLRDGGQIRHHCAVGRPAASGARLPRDPRARLDRARTDRGRRGLDRWQRLLAGGASGRTGTAALLHPLPPALALGGRAGAAPEPGAGRDRLRAAIARGSRRGARHPLLLSQQRGVRLEHRAEWSGDQCGRRLFFP